MKHKQNLLERLLLNLATKTSLSWKQVTSIIYKCHFTNIACEDFAVSEDIFSFSANVDPFKRHLYLQVLGGKAFLEHLHELDTLPGQVCSMFTLYMHFRNQRFRSKSVPCACEPDLNEGFLLELHRESMGQSVGLLFCCFADYLVFFYFNIRSLLWITLSIVAFTGEGTKMADATTMLSMCDPVHLVLIKTDTSSETTLVSSYFLDWRAVLSSPSGKTCFAVELMGVGEEAQYLTDKVYWIIHSFSFI